MTPLALIPLTALLSALHGNDTLGKGWLIAIHVISFTVLGYLSGLSYLHSAFAGVAVPVLFWFVLRGGWQAEEELDYMAGKPWASLRRVAVSHAPHLAITLGFLGYGIYLGHWQSVVGAVASCLAYALPMLALTRWNYEKSPKLINTGKFWDVRRPTEVCTGISGGIQGAAILATATAIWGA